MTTHLRKHGHDWRGCCCTCLPACLPGCNACLPACLPAAYNDEVRTTLLDKRLQEVLLKVDGADNREQVRSWRQQGGLALERKRLVWLALKLERGKG